MVLTLFGISSNMPPYAHRLEATVNAAYCLSGSRC